MFHFILVESIENTCINFICSGRATARAKASGETISRDRITTGVARVTGTGMDSSSRDHKTGTDRGMETTVAAVEAEAPVVITHRYQSKSARMSTEVKSQTP